MSEKSNSPIASLMQSIANRCAMLDDQINATNLSINRYKRDQHPIAVIEDVKLQHYNTLMGQYANLCTSINLTVVAADSSDPTVFEALQSINESMEKLRIRLTRILE